MENRRRRPRYRNPRKNSSSAKGASRMKIGPRASSHPPRTHRSTCFGSATWCPAAWSARIWTSPTARPAITTSAPPTSAPETRSPRGDRGIPRAGSGPWFTYRTHARTVPASVSSPTSATTVYMPSQDRSVAGRLSTTAAITEMTNTGTASTGLHVGGGGGAGVLPSRSSRIGSYIPTASRDRPPTRGIIRVPVMRLVTYDREGDRRLGAWVHDAVVDLPDAVGHPAFPATMEALVTRHRGTALEAARAALANPSYVEEARVRSPRFLAPLTLAGAERGLVLGPGEDVRWSEGTACRWQPELACVLGRSGRELSPEAALQLVFGYLMVSTWSPCGDEDEESSGARLATTLGPCVVTAEDFDPCQVTVTARVNGGVWIRERMGDAASRFAHTIAL